MSQHNVVDKCTGIGTGENQAQLTNETVKNLLGPLGELICINGQGLDVLMLHQLLGVLALGRIVEESVRIHTVFTMLERRISEDIARLTMIVLPDERNSFFVLMLEGIWHNGSAV